MLKKYDDIQNGDLFFVKTSDKPFSKLIGQSTKKIISDDHSHVGIIQKISDDTCLVIHATEDKGCIKETFSDFLSRQKTPVDIFRLKAADDIDFNKILQKAESCLGQPYNPSFIAEKPGFYCSELICHIFKDENIFKTTPMSFGPDGTILAEWHEYYRKLKLPIPNGQPGSSPNSLLRQKKLKFVKEI